MLMRAATVVATTVVATVVLPDFVLCFTARFILLVIAP